MIFMHFFLLGLGMGGRHWPAFGGEAFYLRFACRRHSLWRRTAEGFGKASELGAWVVRRRRIRLWRMKVVKVLLFSG